ncbi:MAG: hypothetical protein HY563_03205, partial [Ignavibacteriales bacterium]|nr:hypothetical protein [Ignavibacteriales bacterium]
SDAYSQVPEGNADRLSVWLPLQAIPNITHYNDARTSALGFEWEVTPLLYSFGINRYISPWYSFIVEPTARFTGSIELAVAGQIFTTKLGPSYFTSSGHLMAFVPLSERGEYLTLNLGVGVYRLEGRTRLFKIVGMSTLFGMLHFNVKHTDNPTAWIGSLEFRVF